jgi:L-fuconolactonase
MTAQKIQKIDTHHHFWKYDPEQYGWISEKMSVIRRDFLPADLKQVIHQVEITGVVSIQSRQTIEETEWLLQLADDYPFIQGVVGWVPLISPSVQKDLERFAVNPKFKAVRHVLHDEPDYYYMLRDGFNQGIARLKPLNLVYDILIFERHLPQTIEFVDRHPNQVFIIDHIAKPRIRDGAISPWREYLKELAKRENVYCKISGVVTEADYTFWTEAKILPYLEVVLEAFGSKRLTFGSDWPVCLVATPYTNWFHLVSRFISKLSVEEQQQIWSGTAIKVYNL